jgi:hypothetical protein
VLGFFALAWLSLGTILLVAPAVYDRALKLPDGAHHTAEVAFLVALSAFLVLLAFGVVRRWRWAFWLILVAFLAGLLRVPAAALGVAGVLPADGPAWYAVFQSTIGLVQFAIGIRMVQGYRSGGIWGDV